MLSLAHAAKALATGTLVAPDEQEQLNYASMLIDVSWNQYSALCKVQEWINADIAIIGLPSICYFTEKNHADAISWLYPDGHLDPQTTILCSTNETVDYWNMIAQSLSPNKSHALTSKDNFEEVDNVKGFLKQMISTRILNTFRVSHESRRCMPHHLSH